MYCVCPDAIAMYCVHPKFESYYENRRHFIMLKFICLFAIAPLNFSLITLKLLNEYISAKLKRRHIFFSKKPEKTLEYQMFPHKQVCQF